MIIDEHLTHFGVKGMRWGRRKTSSSGSEGESSSSNKDKIKTAAKVSAGVAVAAGAGFVLYSLNKSGSTKVSSLPSNPNRLKIGSDTAKRIAQQRASMSSITAKLAATNKLADEQLRGWYNKFDVPIAERTYSR